MSHIRQMRLAQASRGVGLVEVLIGILVLAIGLLGVAALQATTLRNSQGAMERSQATFQTYSILDAMRANVATARALYDNPGTGGCAPNATATSNALVNSDLTLWFADLHTQLGSGTTTCAGIEDLGGNRFQITVQWEDARGSGGTQQIQTVSQL